MRRQCCFRSSGPNDLGTGSREATWGRAKHLSKTSLLSPKAVTAPPCMMASLSVAPRIPIRWVMMITVVLAAFIHSMASKSMRSPSVVEAGVRLVEDHEVRVAEERPRKAEALAKPAREIGASANDDRIVRLRQPDDRLVNAGQLCCFNDLLQIGVVQPCNDVLYSFSEEIDILRQISKAPTAARIAHG